MIDRAVTYPEPVNDVVINCFLDNFVLCYCNIPFSFMSECFFLIMRLLLVIYKVVSDDIIQLV